MSEENNASLRSNEGVPHYKLAIFRHEFCFKSTALDKEAYNENMSR